MKLFKWTLIPTDEYNKIIKTNKQLHNLENWLSCRYGQLLIKIPIMYEGELVSEYEERIKFFMNSIERQADELNDLFYKARLIELPNKLDYKFDTQINHNTLSPYDVICSLPKGAIINNSEITKLFSDTTKPELFIILQKATEHNIIKQLGTGKYQKL